MELQLGKPVTIKGIYTGALIKKLENSALVSFFADGENKYEEIPLKEIEVEGVKIESTPYKKKECE